MEYNTPLTTSGIAGSGDTVADLVFGQGVTGTSFTTNGTLAVSATSLTAPRGIAIDSANNVYISDSSNNRILEYNEAANPPANVTANEVFGTGNSFTVSGTCGAALTDICAPYELAIDTGNNLYVADRSDERVLEFNTPLTNTTADLIFGKALDSACINGPLTGSDLCGPPPGVAVDSAGDVFVSDTGDNRILKFEAPLTTGMNADFVLGQLNFSHHLANTIDAAGMFLPSAVAVDRSSSQNHLYVADTNNSRVLGWRSAATFANGAPADLVIGQVDFSSSANQPLSASSLAAPRGLAVDGAGDLYVADTSNNRR